MPHSRFHLVLAFIALMLLRVVVGYHFFKEGTTKLASGNFTAEPFLNSATGPLAPYFHSIIEDSDGALRFCLTEDSNSGKRNLDPSLTLALWDDFLDKAYWYYKFEDEKLDEKLVKRRKDMAYQIKRARESQDKSIDTELLEQKRAADEASLKTLRQQLEVGEEYLQKHSQELRDWLQLNRDELLAFFATRDREHGFERDGVSKRDVAIEVDSIRDQVTSIKYDRKKQLDEWAGELESIWDSYESAINSLAVDRQTLRPYLKVHRPFRQENSRLQWINRIIPWFDVIVGALLIVGLFTRLASAAGACFLASIIATQPPWVPGAEPTYLYAIELVALIVIFATLAGRMGGLDFFFARRSRNNVDESVTPEQTV